MARTADEIVETITRIAPSFGAINLEDIAAPICFEVEERLKATLDIPVFHDDQHGTAVVILAGLINAMKVTNKTLSDCKIVMVGAGAARHRRRQIAAFVRAALKLFRLTAKALFATTGPI